MNPSQFVFESVDFEPKSGLISLKYSLDGQVHFEERVQLPKGDHLDLPKALLDAALFNFHLIAGISYYKTYCPKEIVVKSGVLNKKQADFWNKLYTQGLGEFFYKNEVDFRGLVNFPYEEIDVSAVEMELPERSFLPLGGGKDSIVAGEMLRRAGYDFDVFRLGKHDVAMKVTERMGKKPVLATRELSPELFRLNEEGAMNGHIPITAYVSFLSVLMSLLHGYRYVVFANEHSANEGNVLLHGMEVNHQYSKSFEFEQDLATYLEEFVTPSVKVFSLLRPLSELAIADRFAKEQKYFDVFSSCNRNFRVKEDGPNRLWCGECPKCAFVFVILAASIRKADLLKIFGKNLLADESLWPLYRELLGLEEVKPFECVGTAGEVQMAFTMALGYGEYEGDVIMENFAAEKLWERTDVDEEELFDWHEEHLIPDFFDKVWTPRWLILGYGKEGHVTLEVAKKQLPEAHFTIADRRESLELPEGVSAQLGDSYLDGLENYDVIVKSPGISWGRELEAVSYRVHSGTQLFFSNLDESNTVIAVTGSKGKSTVATLIYKILKEAGAPVLLVGNIGEPALRYAEATNMIFVMELSSYQLDRLHARPDIAVFTSFFPDHLDVHGSLEKYLEAKANITANQLEGDAFIFHEKYDVLAALPTKAEKIAVKGESELKTLLLGQHNRENLKLVETVAELMQVEHSVVEKVVAEFAGLPHRLELVGEVDGRFFVDDAISTTPESTLAAIDIYGDRLGCLFLGGTDRGYEFDELVHALAHYKVPNLALFPDTGAQIRALFPEDYKPEILETEDMEAAVKFAYEKAPDRSVVLLSTASPSYRLWKNFEEKGKLFQDAVHKLAP